MTTTTDSALVELSEDAARTLVDTAEMEIYGVLNSGEALGGEYDAGMARDYARQLERAADLLDAGRAGRVRPADLWPLLDAIRSESAAQTETLQRLNDLRAGRGERYFAPYREMGIFDPERTPAEMLQAAHDDHESWGHQIEGGRELLALAGRA